LSPWKVRRAWLQITSSSCKKKKKSDFIKAAAAADIDLSVCFVGDLVRRHQAPVAVNIILVWEEVNATEQPEDIGLAAIAKKILGLRKTFAAEDDEERAEVPARA
ncbi:hypothetical protein ACJX0J_033880, partial [Zea mays]